MQTSKTRLVAVSATTLLLISAATAAVAAHPDDGDDPFGFGGERMRQFEQRLGGFGNRFGELRLGARGLLAGAFDGVVRTETTFQTDDGFVTRRVDNGTVASTSDAGLDYTLATGETASVSTDEDTQVIAFSEQSVELDNGFNRERLVPESIGVADIASGSEVVVWGLSQSDGTFLAERIVVRPALDEAEDGAATTEGDAGAEAGGEASPEASPAPAGAEASPEASPAPADA